MKVPPFGLILVAAFAVGVGLNGLYSGAQDMRDAPNALATTVAVFSILMGIGGIAAAALIWRQDRRAIAPLAVWAASAVGASTLAPRAYAPEAGWPAAILGGIMTAAVVVAIVVYTRWRLGVTARGESSPVS